MELYRNGMKTVPDMKALVHYVASVWDSETEESSQSTVEIIMAYIAEHLENELRREELAEAVHLNPDYMARLFKKETGHEPEGLYHSAENAGGTEPALHHQSAHQPDRGKGRVYEFRAFLHFL